ncbi:MAG: anthranilate synthase component I [Thainema sp.]
MTAPEQTLDQNLKPLLNQSSEKKAETASLQPWHWRSYPLVQRTGSDVFVALVPPETAIATLLESPYPLPADQQAVDAVQTMTRMSICAGPPRRDAGQLKLWTPAIGDILNTLQQRLMTAATAVKTEIQPDLPFTGGWLGWLGYDLAWEIECLPNLNTDPLPFPVAYWYEPEWFAVLDHAQQQLWLAVTDPEQFSDLEERLDQWDQAQPFLRDRAPAHSFKARQVSTLRFGTSQAAYEAAVRQAKAYIQAGDIFQTNLSLRFELTTEATGWEIYRQLQQINPSPFASYWRTPWGEVVSCSPERLIQLEQRQAQTRPIAGTRPRGATVQDDQSYEQALLQNRKENAEHIMLVDLERNDLGRVCDWGSVQVNELLTVERYSHVMHLVSNVIGDLKCDLNAIDLIRAVFPGGTITGCPKVRCMEIIEELEPIRRSLFYGSCGYLDQRGHLDLNILIRTLLMAPSNSSSGEETETLQTVWGQVGAGIVADSDPEREWHESIQKAKAQLLALGLKSGWVNE